MSASLALAGMGACTRQPTEKIVPYVDRPEQIIPGRPLFFATSMPLSGSALGLLVESHMGRPTKAEGNPRHPASLGATDIFAQASLLTLYDPDRSQAITHLGQISSWISFVAALNTELDSHRSDRGLRLRLLTETVSSPALARQIRDFLGAFPAARWHQYEPVARDNARAGSKLAFGEFVNTNYHFDKTEAILALDADFLSGPGTVRHASDFASGRRIRAGQPALNRLYVVESLLSQTGALADHRLPVRCSEIAEVGLAVAQALGIQPGTKYAGPHGKWAEVVARDLQSHKGKSLVVAGEPQPPFVHALAHAINQALENAGNTVTYTEPVEAEPLDHNQSLRELTADMRAGHVDALFILGGNPVYTAPADLEFQQALSPVKFRVHLGLYEDETSALSHWHIAEAHYLESWGDARAFDGTASIIQPLIAPLYGGKSAHELLNAMLGKSDRSDYDTVRDYWKSQQSTDFEQAWRRWLHDGLLENTASRPKQVRLRQGFADSGIRPVVAASGGMEIVFRPDPTIWEGRFANNGWLQELPKPITRLTWDNAALLSPQTAQRLGLAQGDGVELRYRGRSVQAPVCVMPGHADDSVTVHLGYGRTRAGRVGNGAGFNAYLLRHSDDPWFGNGLEIRKTGARWTLASAQEHNLLDGRTAIRSGTLSEFQQNPGFAHHGVHAAEPGLSLYPGFKYEGYAWGMAIDLNACVGCNACVVACQAENNIPVVGKDQVHRGREMHWIRIDTYHRGDAHNPETYFQPMLCQHCENAPCEVVCPVNATVHSSEGLNQMVYNRCVGTRYCSNNCPYKVRRFNFYLYNDWETQSMKLLRNPDVTVRSRGVMEKCTYCVQRINAAKITSEKEDRSVRDGEILTACQQVCPAEAIVFGNINDPNSRVAKLKREPLNYGVLEELATQPRTTYLARVRNLNPELEGESKEHPHG
jgi:molybdopterin-containing oxidoreductase family iron-sulfur binding subunit